MAEAAPLVAARTTPYWLPAAHFGTGLGFLAAAALLLPLAAQDLAAGRFLQPRVVTLTHLITLGWLTISIMGALCQLFPVVLGTPLRWIRLSALTLALYAPGLVLFAMGLLTRQQPLMLAGALAFSIALLLFIGNGAATLQRARKRDWTWWTLAAAFVFLLATITFGISLAINLQTGHLEAGRLTALMVHVHVALGGWVMLVVMAVGRRLLPMFLLSHGTSEIPLRVATVAMIAGAFLLSFFHRAMTREIAWIAFALMSVSVAGLATQINAYVRTRHRPRLDAGLRLVLAGVVFVLTGVVIGAVVLFTPVPAVPGYGVAIVGGLALFVAGHYYKILPFLLWNHRFAPLVGKRPLPKIAELFDPRVANAAGGASTVGMLALLVAVLMGSTSAAALAASLITVGLLIEAVQLTTLLRTRVT